MAFFLGLASALLWGVGDFLVRGVSERWGLCRALWYGHAVAALAVIAAVSLIGLGAAAPSAAGWSIGAGGAVLNLAMMLTLYRSLQLGPLPVVAPIVGSYAGVAAVIAIATGTDRVAEPTAIALGVVLLGVVLAAIERDDAATGRIGSGVAWAIACALLGGLNSWLQGVAIVPALGPIRTLLINNAVVIAAMLIAERRQPRPAAPLRAIDGPAILLGLCTGGGFLAFLIGLGTGHIVLVSIIASLASGITALLGAVLLGQRIALVQWLGVALIVAGIGSLHGQV